MAVGNFDVCAADLLGAGDIGLGNGNAQSLVLHNDGVVIAIVGNCGSAENFYCAVLFELEGYLGSCRIALGSGLLVEDVGLAYLEILSACACVGGLVDNEALSFNRIPLVNYSACDVLDLDVCAADLVAGLKVLLGERCRKGLVLHCYLAVYVCAVNLNGTVLLYCEGDILGISVAVGCACLGKGVGLVSLQLAADVVRLSFNGIPLVNSVALTVLNYDVCAADLVGACDIGLGDLNVQRLILHNNDAVNVVAVYCNGAVELDGELDILGVSVACRCAFLVEGVYLACLELAAVDVVGLSFYGIPLVNSVALAVGDNNVCAADLVSACDVGLGDGNAQSLVLHLDLNLVSEGEGLRLGISVAVGCAYLNERVLLALNKAIDLVSLSCAGGPAVDEVILFAVVVGLGAVGIVVAKLKLCSFDLLAASLYLGELAHGLVVVGGKGLGIIAVGPVAVLVLSVQGGNVGSVSIVKVNSAVCAYCECNCLVGLSEAVGNNLDLSEGVGALLEAGNCYHASVGGEGHLSGRCAVLGSAGNNDCVDVDGAFDSKLCVNGLAAVSVCLLDLDLAGLDLGLHLVLSCKGDGVVSEGVNAVIVLCECGLSGINCYLAVFTHLECYCLVDHAHAINADCCLLDGVGALLQLGKLDACANCCEGYLVCCDNSVLACNADDIGILGVGDLVNDHNVVNVEGACYLEGGVNGRVSVVKVSLLDGDSASVGDLGKFRVREVPLCTILEIAVCN